MPTHRRCLGDSSRASGRVRLRPLGYVGRGENGGSPGATVSANVTPCLLATNRVPREALGYSHKWRRSRRAPPRTTYWCLRPAPWKQPLLLEVTVSLSRPQVTEEEPEALRGAGTCSRSCSPASSGVGAPDSGCMWHQPPPGRFGALHPDSAGLQENGLLNCNDRFSGGLCSQRLEAERDADTAFRKGGSERGSDVVGVTEHGGVVGVSFRGCGIW